jgi:hypothetical protein
MSQMSGVRMAGLFVFQTAAKFTCHYEWEAKSEVLKTYLETR